VGIETQLKFLPVDVKTCLETQIEIRVDVVAEVRECLDDAHSHGGDVGRRNVVQAAGSGREGAAKGGQNEGGVSEMLFHEE
jgi:hypothetical protein